MADAAQLRRPAFRGRIGEDVLYAGFAGVTPAEAVGSPVKADNKPGLFFLLSRESRRSALRSRSGRRHHAAHAGHLELGAADASRRRVVRDAAGVSRRARRQLQPGHGDRGHDGQPRPAASVPGLHARVAPGATHRLMPVDPIRLQPFFDRVSAASATYDAALRAHAVATRALALNPTSAQARARLRAAAQAVAEARTALDTGAAHARYRAAARSRGGVHDQRPARRDPGVAGAGPVPGDAGSAARSRPAAHPRVARRDLHVHARSAADAARGRGRAAVLARRRRRPRARPSREPRGGRWRR